MLEDEKMGSRGEKTGNEKKKEDDILNIVQQFVQYFEKIDRGEDDGNSIRNS
ncbi:MAG: hypothetical protein K0R69_417 [Clostridia bacterium]|jgi:hypothetical protein|nr:hypothetical protein [Clostridia bacterium]